MRKQEGMHKNIQNTGKHMVKYKVNIEDIELVLKTLGGKAKVKDIKDKIMSDYCPGVIPENYSSKKSFYETIQRKIEDYCPESSNFDSSKREAKFRRVNLGVYELISPSDLPILSLEEINKTFAEEVQKSFSDTSSLREQRLLIADKMPKKVKALVEIFIRNPDVVAEVLQRANGVCENCNKPAPFNRKKNGTPYLEVHHRIKLANGGEDTVENAIGVCPNCHRALHFGV